MPTFLDVLLDTQDFPARWHCGNWTEPHGWTHVVADLAIFAAYATIPCLLLYVTRRRRDLPFLPVFWLFAAFILSCGLTHLVEATLFWHPWYRLSGLLKVTTALVSWLTVICLVPILPRALALPGLKAVNEQLQAEIAERQRVEARLREQTQDLSRSNQDLRQFSESIMDREERVIALKAEVNGLLGQLGEAPRYLQLGGDDSARP